MTWINMIFQIENILKIIILNEKKTEWQKHSIEILAESRYEKEGP